MSISPQLGGEHRVEIPAGAISYRACGNGSPIVFVHGVGVNGDLWRRVVPRLAGGHCCITPDLPWGSHSLPLKPDADLSLPGMARITADFLEALDLDNVAIVANDTGGAVALPVRMVLGVSADPTGQCLRLLGYVADQRWPTQQAMKVQSLRGGCRGQRCR
jgi:hypothetical protein